MAKTATKDETAAKPVPSTLPASLIKALPTAALMIKHTAEMAKLLPKLEKELKASQAHGAIQLARSFVVFHRLVERMKETIKPIYHDDPEKPGLFEQYKRKLLPEAFEIEGVKSIPLAEGFRVGTSSQYRASIKKDQKDKAYAWLRANKLGDIISSTVNASTLSSAASKMIEDENRELPEELFSVAMVPTTSVTKV